MKTDYIAITSELAGREKALKAADKFIAYNNLTGKTAMHIRLLTEEAISMVHGIMDEFSGDFWLETDKTSKGTVCRICVSATVTADARQEGQLLSVASSGKNESAKGILGKIREAVRLTARSTADAAYLNEYTAANGWYSLGMQGVDGYMYADSNMWSLKTYKDNLPKDSGQADEEWDELEKSIIAKLADDVKVWLRSGRTQVAIEKLI